METQHIRYEARHDNTHETRYEDTRDIHCADTQDIRGETMPREATRVEAARRDADGSDMEMTAGDLFDALYEQIALAKTRALMGETEQAHTLFEDAAREYAQYADIFSSLPGTPFAGTRFGSHAPDARPKQCTARATRHPAYADYDCPARRAAQAACPQAHFQSRLAVPAQTCRHKIRLTYKYTRVRCNFLRAGRVIPYRGERISGMEWKAAYSFVTLKRRMRNTKLYFHPLDADAVPCYIRSVFCGSNSMVEYLPSKQAVASSSLVSRS